MQPIKTNTVIRKSTPASLSMRWPFGCKPAFPTWSTSPTNRQRRWLDMAKMLTQGSFAIYCLIARRLLERGVRFVQLMHGGWTSTATCSRNWKSMSRYRRALGCACHGFEGTRTPGGYAGGLGWRVWTHSVRPSDPSALKVAITSAAPSVGGWRAEASSLDTFTARPMTLPGT